MFRWSRTSISGAVAGILLAAILSGETPAQQLPGDKPTQGDKPLQPTSANAGQPISQRFTYQGQLKKSGAPYNGPCDMQFSLYDQPIAGTLVTSYTTSLPVTVLNGLFTTQVAITVNPFNGDGRYLEVGVRCPPGMGAYTVLSPRTAMDATPYASGLAPGARVASPSYNGGDVFAATSYAGIDAVNGYAYGSGRAGYFIVANGNSSAPAVAAYNLGLGSGVMGQSNSNSAGLHGTGPMTGVLGIGTNAAGSIGVLGASNGTSFGSSYGVYGVQDGGTGTFGKNRWRSAGVWGDGSSAAIGVLGTVTDNLAVAGVHTGVGMGVGVWGQTDSAQGVAVEGINFAGGTAGLFQGAVRVYGPITATGELWASAKHFLIDHPLDPANKYLVHSSVESPEMLNTYSGNVTTDENGDAAVNLPDYFEALNTDYRYQLTVIGQFAQAIVKDEISGNRFTIKTDKPRVKVSWQVTGVRNDPYAQQHPALVEIEKPAGTRGKYLHPQAYQQPASAGIGPLQEPSVTTGK